MPIPLYKALMKKEAKSQLYRFAVVFQSRDEDLHKILASVLGVNAA